MLGGLLHELLTAGRVPFFFLLDNVPLLIARRKASRAVPVTGVRGAGAEGLWGKNFLEAAVTDGVVIPWTVRGSSSSRATGKSPGLLPEAINLIEGCCRQEPGARLTLDDLARRLESLSTRKVAHGGGLRRGESRPATSNSDSLLGGVPRRVVVEHPIGWDSTLTSVQVSTR
jgi:hypothetical protein